MIVSAQHWHCWLQESFESVNILATLLAEQCYWICKMMTKIFWPCSELKMFYCTKWGSASVIITSLLFSLRNAEKCKTDLRNLNTRIKSGGCFSAVTRLLCFEKQNHPETVLIRCMIKLRINEAVKADDCWKCSALCVSSSKSHFCAGVRGWKQCVEL